MRTEGTSRLKAISTLGQRGLMRASVDSVLASFVSWGLGRDAAWEWWSGLNKPDGFEIGRYAKMEEESLDFFVDPQDVTRLQGDTVLLGPTNESSLTSSLLSRYTFSEALSRSSQLSVLEGQLALLLSKVQSVPAFLAKEGKGPYKRKEVIQR